MYMNNEECRKLVDINIYRVDHTIGNSNYVELYFDEHMRLIIIPISQGVTAISMDVYPFECDIDLSSNKRCIALTTPHIELCTYNLIDVVRNGLGCGLASALIDVEAVSICLEEGGKRRCEVINLKLFILRNMNEVLEMCLEDLQHAVNAVKNICFTTRKS